MTDQFAPDALRRQFVDFIVTARPEDLARVKTPQPPRRTDSRGERGPGTDLAWNLGNNKPINQ